MFRTNLVSDVGAAKTQLRTFTPKDLRLTTSDTARYQTVKCDSLIGIIWCFLDQARHYQGPSPWFGINTLVQARYRPPLQYLFRGINDFAGMACIEPMVGKQNCWTSRPTSPIAGGNVALIAPGWVLRQAILSVLQTGRFMSAFPDRASMR